MYAIVNQPPVLRLPPGPLLDILTACLAKDPASRPTAAALLTYLYRTRASQFADPGPRGSGSGVGSGSGSGVGSGSGSGVGSGEAVVPPVAAVQDPPSSLPRDPRPGSPAPAQTRPGARLRQARRPGATLSGTARPGTARPGTARPGLAGRRGRGDLSPVTAVPGAGAARAARMAAARRGRGGTLARLRQRGRDHHVVAGRGRPAGAVLAGRGGGARHGRRPHDLLVVATDDGRVRAWDVATGIGRRYLPDSVAGLTGPGVRVRDLALDPSGGWLAASVDGRLLLWDVTDPGEPLLAAKLPTRAEVTALAFDDTGWRLATGDADGKVHVWDLAELADAAPVPAAPGASAFDAVPLGTTWIDPPGTLPDASRPQSGRVLALAWDDARNRWLSVGARGRPDGAAARGAPTDGIGIAGVPLRAAALSPGGGFAAMIDDARGRVYLANLDGPADDGPADPRVLDDTDLTVTGVAFADSGMLAIGGSDGSLRVWDPSRRATRLVRAAGSPVAAVAASPQGDRLVISDRRAKLTSFTAVNGSFEPGWAVDSPPAGECLAFRADGTRLATAGDVVRIWDAADGSPTAILPGRTGRGPGRRGRP